MRAPANLAIPYDYLRMFSNMKVRNEARVIKTAKKLYSNLDRYKTVEMATDVPAAVIACLHYRESSMNFNTHLYNGDPLSKRTTHEPAGRPIAPPLNGNSYTWEESAADALKYDGAKLDTGIDSIPGWSLNEILYFFEKYNGFGYRLYHKTTPSPYLWAGTTYYTRGKYASDGHFDADLKDGQLGCAPLLAAVTELNEGWL